MFELSMPYLEAAQEIQDITKSETKMSLWDFLVKDFIRKEIPNIKINLKVLQRNKL